MTILILVLFFVSIYLLFAINKFNIKTISNIFQMAKITHLFKNSAANIPFSVNRLKRLWGIYYYSNIIKSGNKNRLPIHKTPVYQIQNDLQFSHNISLEIIWTIIPILFILEMIFPSLSLIADDEIDHKGSIYTINIIGNQWYWNYELNIIQIVIKYVSNLLLLEEGNRKHENLSRLLTTTKTLPVSVGIKTSFYITSNDVAHSWAIPGLGIKVDAIPGRINLKTIIPTRIGLYSGMCSELCGVEHGFMPISMQVLTFTDFWNVIKQVMNPIQKEININDNNIWLNKF